ncbi:hypothetical protein HORIV_44360 [Vreelandella olivaria]|uniref:Uncharacterized protein n=1 Tax=Vreelandella olivaria TaxID=390919 RepID=A0ABN5WYT0_9GAMM|nr:hypothetical protein HORIV_44360 [Halomonas olivaria]
MEVYHGRYLRSVRDYVIGGTEFMLPTLAKAAPLYNAVIGQRWVEQLMRRTLGMSDSPALSRASVKKQLNAWGVAEATPLSLALLTEQQRANSVILVQDAFTTHFEAKLVMDVVELLSRLNLRVFVMPFSANGKPLQVQGFLGAFERTAAKQAERLRTLARFDIPPGGHRPGDDAHLSPGVRQSVRRRRGAGGADAAGVAGDAHQYTGAQPTHTNRPGF